MNGCMYYRIRKYVVLFKKNGGGLHNSSTPPPIKKLSPSDRAAFHTIQLSLETFFNITPGKVKYLRFPVIPDLL